MNSRMLQAALAAAALALPLAAAAQQAAYTAKNVNLRAGPDRAYPIVAVLPAATQVVVQGCIADYRWCDVSFGYERGWVYAGNLRYAAAQGYVAFPGIAPVLGVAVLVFVLDDYWGHHYRDRSWYRDRYRWEHLAPPPPPPRVRPREHRPPAPFVPRPVPPHAEPPRRDAPPGRIRAVPEPRSTHPVRPGDPQRRELRPGIGPAR